MITAFDYLVTPDGRKIPIQGSLSTKENLAKGTIKNVAQHAGVTLRSMRALHSSGEHWAD